MADPESSPDPEPDRPAVKSRYDQRHPEKAAEYSRRYHAKVQARKVAEREARREAEQAREQLEGRVCKVCGAAKLPADFERTTEPAKYRCNDCQRERTRVRDRARYVQNPEKQKAYSRSYVKRNAGLVREKRIARYWSDPERFRRMAREDALKDRAKRNARHTRWRLQNAEKYSEYRKARYRRDPQKYIDRAANAAAVRRAQKMGSGGRFTRAEFRKLCQRYGDRCLKCGVIGVRLEADHVIPLARGGPNKIENIQPLCRSCNAQKHKQIADYRPTQES